MPGPGDGAVLTKVNSLHAQSVGHYVRGGIVGKAGMFVLLRALLVGNAPALAGKSSPRLISPMPVDDVLPSSLREKGIVGEIPC